MGTDYLICPTISSSASTQQHAVKQILDRRTGVTRVHILAGGSGPRRERIRALVIVQSHTYTSWNCWRLAVDILGGIPKGAKAVHRRRVRLMESSACFGQVDEARAHIHAWDRLYQLSLSCRLYQLSLSCRLYHWILPCRCEALCRVCIVQI